MTHQPITPGELATLKTFWSAEDERNGGRSDMSRCIAEIERLQADLEKLADEPDDMCMAHDNGFHCGGAEIAREALSPSQQ